MNRIYFEDFPKWKNGKNKGKIKWCEIKGKPIRFSYLNNIYICYIEYDKKNRKITINHNGNKLIRSSNTIYKVKPEDILGIKHDKIYKDFKYNIGDNIKKDKFDIVIIDRFRDNDSSKTKRYLIKCNICGFDSSKDAFRYGEKICYNIAESNLDNLNVCPCCHGRITQTGINDVATIMPYVVKFFHNENDATKFSPCSKYRIICKCPDCGEVKKNKITINQLCKLKHISCICNNTISLPERIMYNILNVSPKINCNFVYQYKPDWCKFSYNGINRVGIYDFYFKYNGKQYLIEMDGAFHYQKYYKGKDVPQSIVDYHKDKLAKENDYIVLRINCEHSYFDYIKNNIEKILGKEILNDINWENIEISSINNISKLICSDYEEHKNQNDVMRYLEKKYHFRRTAIISHLRSGNKYGWCNYDNKPQWKKVYQFDINGNIINVYDSCNQAMRETGISVINQILIGKVKQRPPYFWSYENRLE